MATLPKSGLGDSYSDLADRYTGSEIARVHKLIEAQVFGLNKLLGSGVALHADADALLCSAGAGLSLNIKAGSGIAEHSTRGAAAFCQLVDTSLLIPASSTLYVFAYLQNSGATDTRTGSAPGFTTSVSAVYDGGTPLAKITTDGTTITSVVDLRKNIVAGSPSVVDVVYASTITINCEDGKVFDITLTGNVTIANFTGTPKNGQIIELRFLQDATGSRLISSMGTVFEATADCPKPPVLSTGPNKLDRLLIQYHAGTAKWYLVGLSKAAA